MEELTDGELKQIRCSLMDRLDMCDRLDKDGKKQYVISARSKVEQELRERGVDY